MGEPGTDWDDRKVHETFKTVQKHLKILPRMVGLVRISLPFFVTHTRKVPSPSNPILDDLSKVAEFKI